MEKAIKTLLMGLFLLTSPMLFAQDAEMADVMRSEGKIYVVVAILLIILFGLIGFLIYTERKVSRLEKRVDDLK